MHDTFLLVIKALCGGAFVVAFALISEVTKPKRFSGLFGPAPAVALAGLFLTTVDKGGHEANRYADGMISGSVAMLVYCLVVIYLLGRIRARTAAVTGLGFWLVVCAALYPVLL